MKINLNYNLPENIKQASQEITAGFVESAFATVYKEGLDSQKRRIYGRIQRKMDEVVLNKAETIELEEAEKDLIKKTFANEDCVFPSQSSKFVVVLEEEIEKL